MGDSACGFLTADNSRNLLLQFRVKGTPPPDARRKAGGILNERAAKALHMKYRRDVVGAVLHYDGLHPALPVSDLLKGFDAAHFQGADLPNAHRDLGRDGVKVQINGIKGKDRIDLGHFFIQVHFCKQVRSPLFGRQIRIQIFFAHKRFLS